MTEHETIDTIQALLEENEELKARLAESEETCRALASGEVDAVVIHGPDGPRVYTLKGAEHAYRIIVEAMTEGAVTTSLDGTVLYANPSLGTILGVPTSSVMGRHLADLVEENEQPRFVDFLRQSRSGPARDRFRIPEGNLCCRTAYFSTTLLQEEGSEPRLCMVVTDVTEIEAATSKLQEIEAEKEILQESERRFRLLAEAIPQIVWTAEPDGTIDYFNR
ncbi:MAG: PAS domain S-box protein, partial [Desulfobacteraceae bacterium]|nr:PAS domain S-box protein [Desulfobacteraceae bacterium]